MTVETFRFGDVVLQSEQQLADGFLRYRTEGRLAADRSNIIVVPTWFCATHDQALWLTGTEQPLDPERYFIVAVDLLGNGESSSPSHAAPAQDGARFPRFVPHDNVLLIRRLLRERFDAERVRLIVGRSMGAQVAFDWAVNFPAELTAFLALTGAAKTSAHNRIFLNLLRSMIQLDPDWMGGSYSRQPTSCHRLLRGAFDVLARSPAFYRHGFHLGGGILSTDEFIARSAEPMGDANDILAQIDSWDHADPSRLKFGGDLAEALGQIEARAIIMPSRTDAYFRVEDNQIEAAAMPHAELRVLDSIWGHRAGAPGSDPRDIASVQRAVADLLTE
jgi:homoserine O-acetyltransferase/O-succinyltransferase